MLKTFYSHLIELNIVTISSPSSQMGFCIAYDYFFENIQCNPSSHQLTIVIVKQSKRSTSSLPRYFNELKQLETARSKGFVWIFVIKNYFDILLIYILLWLATILSPLLTIRLWQPRYKWINELFPSKNLFFSLPVPNFKKVLFGDGFLQGLNSTRPFWFKHKEKTKKDSYINPENLIASIYHFSLLDESCPFDYTSSSFCIPKEVVRCHLVDFLNGTNQAIYNHAVDQILDSHKLKLSQHLAILPTTSFYETNRSSLSSEINLYKEFIRTKFPNSLVVIKPHPISFATKLHQLNYLANDIDGILLGGSSWDIPLELLILQLIKKVQHIRINLIVASTAGISCARLFNEINYTPAFGKEYLKDCLEPNDLESRITQEKLMKKFLDTYSKN